MDAASAIFALALVAATAYGLIVVSDVVMPCTLLQRSSSGSTSGDAAAAHQSSLRRYALVQVAMAVVTFLVTRYVVVPPFGKHATSINERRGRHDTGSAPLLLRLITFPWYFTIPAWLSWLIQESPTLLNVAYFILAEYPLRLSSNTDSTNGYWHRVRRSLDFLNLPLLLFTMHYTHRVLIYSYVLYKRQRESDLSPTVKKPQRVPACVSVSATLYCLLNGRLQVLAGLFSAANSASSGELVPLPSTFELRHLPSPLLFVYAFLWITGSLLFFYGMWVNLFSDYTLLSLRNDTKQSTFTTASTNASVPKRVGNYIVPSGYYFDWLTCPNFFGEIIEWLGYALVVAATTVTASTRALEMTGQSAAAASFVLYVLANLVPRAAAHHEWYRRTFGQDYYDGLHRWRVIPFVY